MDPGTPTDEGLVAAVGRGDMEALAELVRRHQDRTLRLAFRTLGDWHLAEDVTQQAFLRLHRAARRYRPTARFTTWFHRIVVNLCLDVLRRRKRPPAEAAPDGETAAARDEPLRRQEISETQRAVQRAVATLNERERLAVILHRFEGHAHREIAAMTDSTAAAVESLLVRAYRKLRRALAPFSPGDDEKTAGS